MLHQIYFFTQELNLQFKLLEFATRKSYGLNPSRAARLGAPNPLPFTMFTRFPGEERDSEFIPS